MLTLLIVLIVVAVAVVASAGFVVTTRRRRPAIAPPREPAGAPLEAPPETRPRTAAEVVDQPGVTESPVGVVALDEPAVDVAVTEPDLAAPPRFRDRLGRARSLFGGYLSSVRSRERID